MTREIHQSSLSVIMAKVAQITNRSIKYLNENAQVYGYDNHDGFRIENRPRFRVYFISFFFLER